MMKSEYDLSSAVTFLLIGLGLGSALTIFFGPSETKEQPLTRLHPVKQRAD